MGRIKTILIKRTAHKLISMHKEQFKKDFDSNKKTVSNLAEIPSKKLRNSIAGYISRIMTREK